jgi:acyl dehydratase
VTADLDFYALAKGDALPPFAVTFDAADVRAYLEATGEAPERWTEAAPPLAPGAYALAALMERMPLPDGALHAGQEFEFLRTVAPGEALEAELRVAQRSERRGAVLIAFDLELRLASGGATVLRGRSTVVAPAREPQPAEAEA